MTADGPSPFRDAQLAAIVESSTDAIVSKDLRGIVQTWNAAAERLFGWSAEEMIGESIRRLIPPDRQDEEDTILYRVRHGELVSKFETVRRTRRGEDIPVAVTVSPIRAADGTIVGASKIAHDLREQSTLQQELRESQQQFVALAQNIPQLAWMADGKGWIFWYNQRWYDYTGTTLEDMQGWGWKAVHHPDHVERVVTRIQHAWDTGEDWEDTFPLKGRDGQFRWFLSRANALKDDHGNVLLWCGTNTDVTEQRDANARIHLLMEEVNHRARNMLATIQAIVRQTGRDFGSDMVEALTQRIGALAANHDLLNDQRWAGARVRDIVSSQLRHIGDLAERVALAGPDGLMLEPRPAEVVGMAIHELATNALRYGALSEPGGRVTVTWAIAGEGEAARFTIEWRESGGPPVAVPERTGFGSVVITRNPRLAMPAEVDWQPHPDGVVWTLSAPAAAVSKPVKPETADDTAAMR